MSIGKSSITRAVNATATKTQNQINDNITTKLPLDKIGILATAKVPEDIDDIKASITKHGILSPVLVANTAKGDIWLIDGYRRLAAAKDIGITQINATIINVENKAAATRIYAELYKLKTQPKTDAANIHEEKFRVLAVKDHDLPTYLL